MSETPSFIQLEKRLEHFSADPAMHDDVNGIYCCQLALSAAQQGNYAVAALLISPSGDVLAEAANSVFSDGYHSHAHAEMLLVDKLEQSPLPYSLEELTLLVSVEPCPMCLGRLLLSGIGTIRYMTADREGGMLSRLDKLPPAWRNLAQLQQFYPAHISPELRELAAQLASISLPDLRQKLFMHIRP